MNIAVTFHIEVRAYQTNTSYRMLVEHYYSSPQIERFKINGKGERFIKMEKRLSVHKQPWKIIEGEIAPENVKQAAMAIVDIQNSIDKYLAQRKEDDPKEGHIIPRPPINKYSNK